MFGACSFLRVPMGVVLGFQRERHAGPAYCIVNLTSRD